MVRRKPDLQSPTARSNRIWNGKPLHFSDEAIMYFKKEGPVPETLRRLAARLQQHGIPHIFMGATAVNLHGYERTTRDVDLAMPLDQLQRFKSELVGNDRDYRAVIGRPRRFLDPQTQVMFDVLVTGEIAGRSDKQQEVLFPSPAEAEQIDQLPVVSLARLIELKLITWRLKDWADVIELIRVNKLDEAFAERLKPVARQPYLECIDQMHEEDRYNALHEPRDPTD